MKNKIEYEWDEAKNLVNIQKHGLSFAQAKLFVQSTMRFVIDDRKDYKELRYIVTGRIMGVVHVMIITPRSGKIRIISLRRANKREVARYEAES